MRHYFRDVGGWFKFGEAFDYLLNALPLDRPSTFVEIGLWMGRSTSYLGVEIVNRNKPISILAIDHFKGQPEIVGWRAELVPESEATFRKNIAPVAAALGDRFRLLVSDSVEAASQVPDDSVDVVWLDGAHDFDGVSKDIAAWWPKLKVGGFMGGDDFIKCEGVKRAVLDRFSGRSSVEDKHYWLVQRQPDGSVVFLS